MTESNIQPTGNLEKVLSKFDEHQRRGIMANVGSIQLTDGCSIGCSFCGFESKKGVRDYIPFELIESLVEKYKTEFAKAGPFLYYASDPFDYDFDGHTYIDVHNLFENACNYSPFVSTAVPRGKEEFVIKTLLENNGHKKKWNNNLINRISVSYMNRKRLAKAFSKHIPSLNPIAQTKITYFGNGQKESYEKIIRKKFGLDKKEYSESVPGVLPHGFDWYSAYIAEIPGRRFLTSWGSLVNFREVIGAFTTDNIRDILDIDFNMAKLGKRNKENLSKHGIGCYHGVLMDPSGVYNLRSVRPSPLYPTGQIKKPINPLKFKVAKLKRFGCVKYPLYRTVSS
jgi:hypothetical protein